MGQLITKARRCVQKIEYYRRHGGVHGYKQAQYHWFELSDLLNKALSSKKWQGEAAVIESLRESVQGLIEEMRKRAGVED